MGAMAGGATALGLAMNRARGDEPREGVKVKRRKNSDFYKDGKLDQEAAKKAYFDMMKDFDYPIPASLREGLWVLDFALGHFAEAGMGGIFWINQNEKDGGYLGHEIYLLPGQMIPEHWHVKTEAGPAKMEAWHLRHGGVTLMGEGDATPNAEQFIPPGEVKCTTVRRATTLQPGGIGKLDRVEGKHFMVGGPKGCIVTEYATFHDMKGLRFTNPDVKL
jgi:D-lyxose ketol-isomerase